MKTIFNHGGKYVITLSYHRYEKMSLEEQKDFRHIVP